MTATMDRPTTGAPPVFAAEDLLKKMRAGTKTTFEIRMRDLVIPVRILSQDEWNLIRRDAKLSTELNKGDNTDRNVLIQKNVLKLASTPPGSGPLLGDKLLSLLTQDEMSYLYNEYLVQVDSINPELDKLTLEEFTSLVALIKKKSISSKDCSLKQLRAIFSAFAELIEQEEQMVSPPGN